MSFALVYYPSVGRDVMDRIRRKYDPLVDVIGPHLTLVFPIPKTLGEEPLIVHIENVLRSWKPFSIRLNGFEKSPDHWLCLTVQEGRPQLVELFDQLYRGALAGYRRHDIEFVPHVGLGLFVEKGARYTISARENRATLDELEYRTALAEAQAADLDVTCNVSKLDLLEISDAIMDWAQGKRPEVRTDQPVITRAEFAL